MKAFWISLICIIFFSSCDVKEKNSQGRDFLNNISQTDHNKTFQKLDFFKYPYHAIEPTFQRAEFGSVTPKGWIEEMMKHDIREGMVIALKDLYPGIKKDDLYRFNRRGKMEDVPEMGDLVLTGEDWEKSIMWWNAETTGNWWDGFIRHAYLCEDQFAISMADSIVQHILDSQDKDGYIGIYKDNLRYNHNGSNGELWAQTTVLRALLGYYELTKKNEVLNAIERALALTMNKYSRSQKNPFDLTRAFGGATHGLMITDVCEIMFSITKKTMYQDYAVFLYESFSSFHINNSSNDIRYPYLIMKDSLFVGHGVHTYEHIRSLVNAYYWSGYNELKQAYDNMLFKLNSCILPSGAGHGNEWISNKKAHPTKTATEYCAMVELRNSFASILQKTGKSAFGDKAEKLTYNGLLGFRNKTGTAISYGKSDNCYILDGEEMDKKEKNPRYKYSPTHSEPAVCCVPNYARNLPYFIHQMWMKKNENIVIQMFGPSKLETRINQKNISIEQRTNYPFSDKITIKITTEGPTKFSIFIRKPEWCDSIQFSENSNLENGYYEIRKIWNQNDSLQIHFDQKTQIKEHQSGEYYIQRGALVYALEIPHEEKRVKSYGKIGFYDYHCYPTLNEYEDLEMKKEMNLQLNEMDAHTLEPWYHKDHYIKADFYNKKKGITSIQKLVPMGSTVLRKVSFNITEK